MLVKSEADEIQSFLSDASNLAGGHASRVVVPETAEEAAEALASAARERVPVTVAGAGTGIVGGRVPFGGVVLSTHRLTRIGEVVREGAGGRVAVGAGVSLIDLQRAADAAGLLYPPDPTEWSCSVGGTVATNASGARTFKYGPTRSYVRRLKVALSTGDVLDLRRGDVRADASGRISIPTGGGRTIDARLPSYTMPRTRKHAAGYYAAPGADAVDLFVGSEGTLGVVTEVELALLPRPEGVLCGIVFFREEDALLAFVAEARAHSFATRARTRGGATRGGGDAVSDAEARTPGAAEESGLDARALEYFDADSLNFLRERFALVPLSAAGAIFFEQEITEADEDRLMQGWLRLLERHGALLDDSWFGTNEYDRAEMREFRHQLPVMVNEWLARHGQRKISTDTAVPDEAFPGMLRSHKQALRARRLQSVVFGHVGDSHVHVNIMPRDDLERLSALDLYAQFVRRSVQLGGTVSAEHGVGKLKRDYLRLLYGEPHLREMAALKRAFDPACVLGRGNIFAEELLANSN